MLTTSSAETISLGAGEYWRKYRLESRSVYLSARLASDEADKIYDLVAAPAVPESAERIGSGWASKVYRMGDVALKQFHDERSRSHFEPLHGRLANLQASVQITRALREYPQRTKVWVLRGIEYWGACIDRNRPEVARWAMEYVDGISLLQARDMGIEIDQISNRSPLVRAQYTAAELAGINTRGVFFDNTFSNFLVTNDSLAMREAGQPYDIARIDIGAFN